MELEPLVEICPKDILFANEHAVLNLDLMTAKKEDLDFANKYTLTAEKNGYINGLVMWFDTLFTFGKRVIKLTTNPEYQTTHWKQTVFYFKEDIAMKAGEEISGTILIKKNEKNMRDLDIKISYHYEGKNQKVDGQQFYLFA